MSLIRSSPAPAYDLKVFALDFAGLRLAPTVSVEMVSGPNKVGEIVFNLSSLGYDPGIRSVFGGVDSEMFGIVIDVVGQLKVSPGGEGVKGKVGFRTSGKLQGPLLLVPDDVLKRVSEGISARIVEFAKKGFEEGAKREYRAWKDESGAGG
ncbi:hypothetical protein TrCOL_g5697 [Triparma columacea]|uniref:Uncharacterized protein n=1 Tax=Triparma columacea TaxID=722753 RepID=A0A9W7GNH8_9STRA|nr:hypothetical protein TrCOL_g5697 [Triparma columacea]